MKLDVDFSGLQDCADMMVMEAADMGSKARRSERDIKSNPFTEGDRRHNEWIEGFKSVSDKT